MGQCRTSEGGRLCIKDAEHSQDLVSLISRGPIVVYTCEAFGDFAATSITPNIKTQLGYTQEAFLSAPDFWSANIHPEDKAYVFEGLKALFEKGTHSHEYRFLHKDGTYRWMHDDLQLVVEESGTPKIIIGYWTDVTEHKQMAIELEEREERFRKVFRSSPGLTTVGSLKDGRLLEANDAWLATLGYTREEVVGKTVFELGLWEDPKQREKFIEAIENDGSIRNFRTTVLTKAGERRHIAASGELLDVASPPLLVVSSHDVTDWVKAEQKLRLSEKRFRDFASIATDWYWEMDDKLRFQYVSGRYTDFTGIEPEEVIGLTRQELAAKFHTKDEQENTEKWQSHFDDIDARRPFSNLRFCWARPDEEGARVFHISGHPLFNPDGTFSGYRGVGSDITEHISLEEQLRQSQKMEAIGQLTGGIAHDFNNLLHVSQNSLELLKANSDLGPKSEKFLDTAMRAGRRGAALIDQLLSFARQQPLIPRTLDVNKTLKGMVSLLERSLGEQIGIETALEQNLPLVQIDQAALENSVLNLAINARNAMPQGGTLTFQTLARFFDENHASKNGDLKPGTYVEMSVTDTGSGMDEDVRKNAFEPFFTTAEVGEGSGLGLSMVYGFLKQSGGGVVLESEPGVGTTVRVLLPVALGESTLEEELSPSEPRRGNATILIVEDDSDVRSTVATMLRSLGYNPIEASSGEPALAILDSATPIDLMFTDIVMPGRMNGIGLAKEALLRRASLKIAFTSGYPEPEWEQSGFLQNGYVFLNKPYTCAQLSEALRGLLGSESSSETAPWF